MKAFLTLALILITGPAFASEPEAVPCESLSIHHPVANECYRVSEQGARGKGGSVEMIRGVDGSVTVAATKETANNFSYVNDQSVEAVVSGAFERTAAWQDASPVNEFEIAEFRVDPSFNCAGFIKNIRPFSQGYRERVSGYYCVDGRKIRPDELSKVLANLSY